MTYPPRTDQQSGPLSAGTPGSRSGSSEAALTFDSSGLALDTTVQQVNSTLGVPAQQGTLVALNTQIVTAGAQPWVPNMHTVSRTLQPVGVNTMHTFVNNARIWGATVTLAVGTTTGSGTQQAYAQVKTGGGVVLAIVEAVLAGATSNDSNTSDSGIPGLQVLSGDTIVLDINNGVALAGVTRASCKVLFSVP